MTDIYSAGEAEVAGLNDALIECMKKSGLNSNIFLEMDWKLLSQSFLSRTMWSLLLEREISQNRVS